MVQFLVSVRTGASHLSEEKKSALRNLEDLISDAKKSGFWPIYQAEITNRYVQAAQAVMQNADGDEAKLRVSAALMSAYHTVLNLPDIMVQQAEANEVIEENQSDADTEQPE